MFKIPTQDGETSNLYHEEDVDGYDERIVVECKIFKGRPRWTIRFETGERFEDDDGSAIVEWMPGIAASRWTRHWHKILIPLRDHVDMNVASLIKACTKGSDALPNRDDVRVAKSRGWWVDLSCVGDLSTGEPILDIEFKRPLAAEEMVAFLGRMASAIDALSAEGYEFAR